MAPSADNRSRTEGIAEARASWPLFATYALWAMLLAPLTIFLHELTHFLTALSLGFPEPEIHFSAIAHGDVSDRPGWQAGLVGLAGPVATILLILLAIGGSRRWPTAAWPPALAIAAASRLFVGVPYTLMNLVALARGDKLDPPAFDEYKAGLALGLPPDLVLGAFVSFFFVTIFWLIRHLPRGQRLAAWPGLILGTALGWVVWFALVGPVLLP